MSFLRSLVNDDDLNYQPSQRHIARKANIDTDLYQDEISSLSSLSGFFEIPVSPLKE